MKISWIPKDWDPSITFPTFAEQRDETDSAEKALKAIEHARAIIRKK